MLVRGIGIRDISAILRISVTKVLKVLTSGVYTVQPKKKHYDCLEIDEFLTYVGEKKNKVRLIYAYHRESGEIAGYVWGKRDLKTAEKPRKRLIRLGISWDTIAADDWDSFLTAFADNSRLTGTAHTAGIEGNNRRSGAESDGFSDEPAAFPRSSSIIGKPLVWLSTTSIMASFELHHTLWITTKISYLHYYFQPF
jgi:IS1 family transposase